MHTRHIAALVVLTAATIFAARPGAQPPPAASPHEQLRLAVDAEVVDGDVPKAIELYGVLARQIDREHRDVAATALLRLADLYERIGNRRAAQTYHSVIARFGDLPAVAAAARQRLPQGLSQVQLWSSPRAHRTQAISPDGRYAAFIAQDANLRLRDLSAGTDRPVTHTAQPGRGNPTQRQGALNGGAAFSRDGQLLAYQWNVGNEAHLRVVRLTDDGAADPKPLVNNPDIPYIQPFDWTPDGQAIVVGIFRPDLTFQIALVSARDGTIRVLKSIDWDRPESMSISPDGRYLAFDLPASDDDRNRDVFVIALDGSLESRVAPGRSQDLLAGWSTDGRHLLFASNRSGANALHAVPMANGAPTGRAVVVKPDLGLVRLLGIANGRLHYEVNAFPPPTEIRAAPVDFSAASLAATSLPGQVPAENYSGAVWSPDGKLLAYEVTEYTSQRDRVIIRAADTNQVVRVLEPKADQASELRWAPDGRSFLTLSRLKGRYAISRLDAETGELTTIVQNPTGPALINRGQSWSADGAHIYYRRRVSVGPASEALIERTLATGEERELHRLERGTYGVAIVASPDGRYLAVGTTAQQQGATLIVSPADGAVRELRTAGEVLRWTPDGQAIWMTVGTWPDQVSLARVPIDGSPAVVGPRFPRGWGMSINPAGTRAAFFTTEEQQPLPREIWALDGLMTALASR